ncbi:MAG TPA: magnesium/cobalt transporter CorA [Thermomicrobiales bacterium]|nr:magnesium/cobalt transporter CorA [Thermomicrobiales bacterium]
MSLRVFDTSATRDFRHVTISDIPTTGNDRVVWVDATGATAAEIEAIGDLYGFHSLAIEDARKRQQRPKIDLYGDHLFIVLYALDPPDESQRQPTRELSMFVTPSVIVTVHRHDIAELDDAARRWAEHCHGNLPETAAMLAYTISDSIVDGYFPALDEFGERIDDLERAMFENGTAETLELVFRMKRQLLEIRRVVAPTRDVFNAFTRREFPAMGENSLAYYQDVYDHVIRTTDTIDAYRDILSSVIDVHLTLVSNRLNQTVRTLTVASIILMSLSLIAGIYGMNFEYMPELTWRYGYYMALAAMVVIGSILAYLFRRFNWW